METTVIDIDFLKSKEYQRKNPWNNGELNYIKSGRNNINVLSDNVLTFTEYNLLATGGSSLDGHYNIFVNYKTFDYLVSKNSEYGSLTYTLPTKEKGWTKLNTEDKKIIEAIIASKLLGAYYQDGNAVNRNGVNLFSNGKCEPSGTNIRNEVITRWMDGPKRSLICDYRGYMWTELKPNTRTAIELASVKLLDPYFKSQICTNVKPDINNLERGKTDTKLGYRLKLECIVNNKIKILYLVKKWSKFSTTISIQNENYSTLFYEYNPNNFKPKDFINILPKWFESL